MFSFCSLSVRDISRSSLEVRSTVEELSSRQGIAFDSVVGERKIALSSTLSRLHKGFVDTVTHTQRERNERNFPFVEKTGITRYTYILCRRKKSRLITCSYSSYSRISPG